MWDHLKISQESRGARKITTWSHINVLLGSPLVIESIEPLFILNHVFSLIEFGRLYTYYEIASHISDLIAMVNYSMCLLI